MKYIILLFFILIQSVCACEITLPAQIVIFNKELSGSNIYHSMNCETKVIDELHHLISELEGRIANYQVKELMANKGIEVEITSTSTVVHQFSTIIREQMMLPAGVRAKSSIPLNFNGSIGLLAGDSLQVNCETCLFGAQQPLNVTVKGFDGTKRTFIVTTDFSKMVRALRLVSPLPSFSSLSDSSYFKEELTESIPHTDLMTDLEALKFYRTNKPLMTGQLLRRSDVSAIDLVKAGLKTEVILENQMVRIKTQGISRSNGALGDLVEVFHPQKNKKYQGKVIDINKVLIEL